MTDAKRCFERVSIKLISFRQRAERARPVRRAFAARSFRNDPITNDWAKEWSICLFDAYRDGCVIRRISFSMTFLQTASLKLLSLENLEDLEPAIICVDYAVHFILFVDFTIYVLCVFVIAFRRFITVVRSSNKLSMFFLRLIDDFEWLLVNIRIGFWYYVFVCLLNVKK